MQNYFFCFFIGVCVGFLVIVYVIAVVIFIMFKRRRKRKERIRQQFLLPPATMPPGKIFVF